MTFAEERDKAFIKAVVDVIKNGAPLKDEVMIATLMSLVTDKDYKPKLGGKEE